MHRVVLWREQAGAAEQPARLTRLGNYWTYYVLCHMYVSLQYNSGVFLSLLFFCPHRTSISRDVMLKTGLLKVQCAGFWGNYW